MIFTFLAPLIFSLMAFIFFIIGTFCMIKFILYIFQSFGLLNIAKNEGYSVQYIVWIPGISHYVLGKFAVNNKIGIIYSILTITKIVLAICLLFIENKILFYSFLIYLVIYFIIDMIIMNKFYKKVYKKSQIFTIFTIITLGLLKPIFIYLVKINKISKYKFNKVKDIDK